MFDGIQTFKLKGRKLIIKKKQGSWFDIVVTNSRFDLLLSTSSTDLFCQIKR